MDDKYTPRQMARACAAFNLRRVTRVVSQHFDRHLRPLGIKVTQFSLLSALSPAEERLTIGVLARGMGMDRTTLTRNLGVLVERGLVRLEEGQDRREHLASLTPQGRQVYVRALPLWEKAQAEVTEAMGHEDWRGLLDGLRRLNQRMRQSPPSRTPAA